MARLTRMLLLALLGCALLAAPASATHVACDDAITQDTTLDSDLLNCSGDGLRITGNDITVDFAGHTLDGTRAGNGVSAERDVQRFTLVRGTIREFHDGVYNDDPHATLLSMRILDNADYGVEAYGGGAAVRDSVFTGNDVGTWEASPITGSTFTGNRVAAITLSEGVGTITDNEVRRNGAGILVGEGDGIVARNVVTDNPGGGISWSFSGEGSIRENLVARNGVGISVFTFAEPAVEHNTVLRNRSHGIFGRWADGQGSVVTGNTIQRNGGNGIFVTGFAPCPELRDNDLERNGRDGIFVDNLGDSRECDALRVTGNAASRNAADGIRVADNTGPVLVEANRAHHNGDDGIDIDPQAGFAATAVWSPDGQQLAFSTDPASGGLPFGAGLYVSAPDGSGSLRLAAGEHPDWSPDGQRIVFAARSTELGVYTIRPDGTGLVKVAPSTSRPSYPTWSPDGQTILYDDAATIFTVPASGATPTALTSGTPANNAEWSPDGSRILFESSPFILGDGNLYLTDPSGSPATLLATGHSATWAPDGSHIVFVRNGDLFVIGADGTGLRPLTSGSPNDSLPSWSPDGTAIAFPRDGVVAAGVYLVEPDGTDLHRIAAGGQPAQIHGQAPPDWSRDSTRIAFDDGGRLWLVRRDGSGLTRLTLPGNPLVTLPANTAGHNRDLGIEAAPGVVDGGGNRARHNGDPRQCVNVGCR